jgi:hypothetical protein
MTMQVIYAVQKYRQEKDFANEVDARAYAETFDDVCMVTFIRERNLPYCQPEFVDRSCAMHRWRNGQWEQCNIF